MKFSSYNLRRTRSKVEKAMGRKQSWRLEEYVGKATLQLLDFDGGASPEQAWRRRLNSHANRLKEFSVTFMEALKMMSLGVRLWSYEREEASQGRAAKHQLMLSHVKGARPLPSKASHLEKWEVEVFLGVSEGSSSTGRLFLVCAKCHLS